MRVRRTVPPVGYRTAATRLFGGLFDSCFRGGASQRRLLREVTECFGVRSAFGVSSGKAALTVILRSLHSVSSRRKVIIPAYTCFSVPSAIVKAGLYPVPCDLATGTFDYDYAKLRPLLEDDVLCALSIHLFGIPADTERLKGACMGRGIFVVEDAAQAMGVSEDGRMLGTRGDVGFFSLGRGKNITCGGGGLIVSDRDEVCDALGRAVAALPAIGFNDDLVRLVTLTLLGAFISPTLYWLPSGIPCLRLGETPFHRTFPVAQLSDYGAAILAGWCGILSGLNAVRRERARFYVAHIEGGRDFGDIPYLRFPVRVPSAAKRRLLADQDGAALGISGMYPTAVTRIPELRSRFEMADCPEADHLAAALVTLPTHALVAERDLWNICRLISAALNHDQAKPGDSPRGGVRNRA